MSEHCVAAHAAGFHRLAERICTFGPAPYCGVLVFFHLVSMDPALPYFSKKPGGDERRFRNK